MSVSSSSAARGASLLRALAALVPAVAWPALLGAATAAALAVLGLSAAAPEAASEARFLALWAGGAVFLTAAAGGALAPGAALLAVTAAWVLPTGAPRGAAVGCVLVLALASAAWRATRREIDALSLVALSLGAQLLFQPQLLLAPLGGAALVTLVALPTLGALATSLLAERHGRRAWVAAAIALVLGHGWRLDTALALLALAGGSRLGDGRRSRLVRGAGLVALLLPLAVQLRGGALAAGAGTCLALPAAAPAIGAAAVAVALVLRLQSIADALALLALAAALLPVLPWTERRALRTLAAGALLCAAAALGAPEATALAGPLALLAGEIAPAALPLQGAWSGVLTFGAALLAAYPWLRSAPLASLLAALDVGRPGGAGFGALAILAGGGLAAAAIAHRAAPPRLRRVAPFAVALLTLLVLLVRLPGGGRPLLEQGVELDPGHASWQTELHRDVGEIAIDSTLSSAAELPRGTPVAVLRLRDASGRTTDFPLRVGEETAEWAAGRPDLAQRGIAAPAPWAQWVAGDFFGRRYRALWTLPRPTAATGIALERDPRLPATTAVTLLQVSVR